MSASISELARMSAFSRTILCHRKGEGIQVVNGKRESHECLPTDKISVVEFPLRG